MNPTALDACFAQYYARHPVNATFTGVHEHDGRLPDWSLAARAIDVAEMRVIRARLEHEHPLPAPGLGALRDDPVSLDAELARANIDVRIAETESGFFHDRNPALWTGEAIFGAVSLMIRDFAPAAARIPALTARLAAVPAFLGTMQVTVAGIPALWRARAVRECGAATQLFGGGLEAWLLLHATSLSDMPHEAMDALHAAAQGAQRAFADCGEWLESAGASAVATDADERLDAGEELLTTLLTRGHYCTTTPRALLAEALAAMDEERRALARALAEREMDWPAAQAAMVADRVTAADYPDAFMRRWAEIRAGVLAHDAVHWPDWPIRYVPIPAWARTAAPQLYWLFYRSPAPFDRYDVYDYLVTPVDDSIAPDEQARRLSAWNRSTITLNHVVHHGGVGHHVQNWHAVHASRSRVGTIAAVDCASRIGMFLGGSMAEGWACYATGLTEELGLLTPLEQLSEQHTRVRLLARAIVDLRLHLGDWAFDECVAFYMRETGMGREVATGEAGKNSMFPATALMYWLGTRTILDARSRAQASLSERFSLRAFHEALLSRGAIPVLLAAELITPISS